MEMGSTSSLSSVGVWASSRSNSAWSSDGELCQDTEVNIAQKMEEGMLNFNAESAGKNYRSEVERDGYLELYLGPMFAGKTSRLLIELTRMADLGMDVLYINYKGDTRETRGGDGLNFSSHCSSLLTLSSRVHSIKVEKLAGLDVSKYQVVGVDEGNFFPDLVEEVLHWVEQQHLHVYVCGLDGDYRRRPLGRVLELLPYADQYSKIVGCCLQCLEELRKQGYHGPPSRLPASFTVRSVNSEQQLLIGGAECYFAVCRRHQQQHVRGEK